MGVGPNVTEIYTGMQEGGKESYRGGVFWDWILIRADWKLKGGGGYCYKKYGCWYRVCSAQCSRRTSPLLFFGVVGYLSKL